jgi:endonuclease III
MATMTNKQKLVSQVFAVLGKSAKLQETESEPRPLLEEFIYALLREGATAASADQALQALKTAFFDWNEIRVSAVQEIAEVIGKYLKAPESRSQRIIDFLQEVFESNFSFDLDPLAKKGLKAAAKSLSGYKASTDYAVAWVMQRNLGGHAVPVDGASRRALVRLGMIDENDVAESVRNALEHQVPKAKNGLFVDLMSWLTKEYCWEKEPNCPQCPMKTHCQTGVEVKAVTSKKPR